jgi:hypothetical protein
MAIQSNKRKIVKLSAIVLACILAFTIGAFLFNYYNQESIRSQRPNYPAFVQINGTVHISPSMGNPSSLIFTNLSNGTSYIAKVTGNYVDIIPSADNVGQYTISLPNCNSYSVTLVHFFTIYQGEKQLGTLILNQTSTNLTKNWTIN